MYRREENASKQYTAQEKSVGIGHILRINCLLRDAIEGQMSRKNKCKIS